jgi:ABC-type branched-subunit amino acid transport system permease subunit
MGPIVGAVVVIGVEYLSSQYLPDRWPLILAAIIVVAIMVIPQGLGVLLIQGWRRLTHGAS